MRRLSLLMVAAALSSGAALGTVADGGDRAQAMMRKRQAIQGRSWQSNLPPLGVPSPADRSQIKATAPGCAFAGASSASNGEFCECSIHDASNVVGRILFNLASENEFVATLESLLGARCVELQHIDVVEAWRGKGGGPLLFSCMLASLAARDEDVAMVLLQHKQDYSFGGDLVQWYRSLGFEMANEVLPLPADMGLLFQKDHMIASVADLNRIVAQRVAKT